MGIVKPGNYGILGKKRIFFRGYANDSSSHSWPENSKFFLTVQEKIFKGNISRYRG
jgi:hypothetical protein